MKEEKVVLSGAVLAAITASICCIVPLVFLLLGVGAFGAAAAFESARPYLLSAALLLLAFGFFRAYIKPKETCPEGKECEIAPIHRASRAGLWLSSLAVVAFALWPYYADAAIKRMSTDAAKAAPITEKQTTKAVFTITGMTCDGCEPLIDLVLEETKGVKSAEVSYDRNEAVVEYDPALLSVEKIREIISETGYVAEIKK